MQRLLLAIGCLIASPVASLAQPAPFLQDEQISVRVPPPVFVFGAGVHKITADALLSAQGTLKATLNGGGLADPNDMLVFECRIEPGRTLLWWQSLQQVTVTDVFAEYDVVDTVDPNGHIIALAVLSVGLEDGGYSAPAYLMILRDDFLQVGAALPITAETWDAFFLGVGAQPLGPQPASALTCAEQAVDWCHDWYPPCAGGSGLGGIIGCAEQAACTNADCHNLACITNANDCCERGYGPTWCEWEQWLSGGESLEHVTCDIVYAIELSLCIPKKIKEIFD